MPSAGDPYLTGQLPAKNNPLNRLQPGGFNTKSDPSKILAMWTQWAKDTLFGIIKTLTGIDLNNLNGLLGGVGDSLSAIDEHIQESWDDVVTWFGGIFGGGATRAESTQAIANQATTTASLSAAVAAIQSEQSSQGNGGNSALVNFTTRPDATSLGSDFTQTYTGSGTCVLGITAGKAAVQPVNDADRTCMYTYNVLQSLSDYQAVGQAFASAPQGAGFNPAHNFIRGRVDAAGTSYVQVDLTGNSATLGCVVAGTLTVFTSVSISFKANSIYWLVCGTAGGARSFQVLEGNTPIISWTEVGTTSQLGASYRYSGGGALTHASVFGSLVPGQVTAFAFTDNTPAPVLGSGATITRTGTSTVSAPSGTAQLPNSFYNNIVYQTADITVDLVNNAFVVANTGWYCVTVAFKTSSTYGSQQGAVLYLNLNATPFEAGPTVYNANNSVGVFAVYLSAGDAVSGGTFTGTGASITGDAAGTYSYMSICLASRSLA